ncbi:MAG: IS4 family transposase [Bacteroidetes bacterium]|nr:IS4 family transposase [Bacteroidota bacterium]
MKIETIISKLPTSLFSFLSKKYEVDYKVKKLKGETIFMVLLHSMFSEQGNTLRKLKYLYNDNAFQNNILGSKEESTIDHTSFHYRLNNINPLYFKEIFKSCLKIYKPLLSEINTKNIEVLRFDSILVSLSSKLAKSGFQSIGSKSKTKNIKYSIGYSDLPEICHFYSEKKYKGENTALKEVILSEEIPKQKIILFDRGLTSREVFDEITSNNNYFISRMNKSYKIDIINENKDSSKLKSSCKVLKELRGYLFTKYNKKTKYPYRVIHQKSDQSMQLDPKKRSVIYRRSQRLKHETKSKEELEKEILNEDIIFVTNIPEALLDSEEIGEIYRKRWDIEVFFKFLKQELNFTHLVNRTPNGIQTMMYMTMIFSMMLLVYKNMNNLKGYKHVKHKLMLELQYELYKFTIQLSGGSVKRWENSRTQFWRQCKG